MLESTERRARELGAQRIVALCRCVGGTLELLAGQWREAEISLREAHMLYQSVGVPSGQAASLQRLALVLLATGRVAEARATIAEGIFVAQKSAMRAHVLVRLYAALARAELAAGDCEAARQAIEDARRVEELHGRCMSCTLNLEQERVQVELAGTHFEAAERAAEQLHQVAERFGSTACRAIALLARARIAARKGAGESARRDYQAAGAAYAEAGCPVEAAAVEAEAAATTP
jgi:hypothetical protein